MGFSAGLPSAIRTGSTPGEDVTSLKPSLVFGVHLGDDVGVLGGDVVQLERIVFHVEELEARLLAGAGGRLGTHELVRLRPRGEGTVGLGLVASVPLEKQSPFGPAGVLNSFQERDQALAVEADAGRRRHAAGIEQRRRQVDMSGDTIDDAGRPGIGRASGYSKERGCRRRRPTLSTRAGRR